MTISCRDADGDVVTSRIVSGNEKNAFILSAAVTNAVTGYDEVELQVNPGKHMEVHHTGNCRLISCLIKYYSLQTQLLLKFNFFCKSQGLYEFVFL